VKVVATLLYIIARFATLPEHAEAPKVGEDEVFALLHPAAHEQVLFQSLSPVWFAEQRQKLFNWLETLSKAAYEGCKSHI